jgi:protocatechuate 3,4-dioxygenase beta subunit
VAASLVATSPSEQAATVNGQYAQPLQVKVLDAHGAGVKDVTVTFALGTGSSGAGASFLGGGAQTTAETDASGQATSPAVVANGSPGKFTATATAAGIATVVSFSLDNHAANYAIKATSPAAQTATINSRYAAPLRVQVLDEAGQPLEGATVTFTLSTGPSAATAGFLGGAGAQATALTDVSGQATSPALVANGTPGRFTATATVPGGISPVSYALRNLAGRLTATRTVHTATVNQRYRERLRARVVGANGQPLDGITVTFTLSTGPSGATAGFLGGAGAQATALTDVSGQATSPALVANGTPGRFTATATVPDGISPVSYALRNLAGRLTATRTVHTATVNQGYRERLRARVLGAQSRPLDGITVTFTITKAANGAGATFPDGNTQATATTNGAGWATSPVLAANSTAGSFTASATSTGIGKPLGYRLRNVPGKPDSVTAGAASGESTPVGTRFPIRLAVTVLDADDNPLVGAIVTFTAPANGPSGRFTIHPPNRPGATRKSRIVRVRTDSEGIAVAPPLTANATPGGYVVAAVVARSRQHTAFALVNKPAP